MRIPSRIFAALTALVLAFSVPLAAAYADPRITAYIGAHTATSHLGYFVLDFNAKIADQETYAFAWNYEGTKSDADFLVALQSALTGDKGFTQTGAELNFVTGIGFNGRSKFNDFAGHNSGEPNGYWNLWLGPDGTNWTSAQFGAADSTLNDTLVYSLNPFTGTQELSGAPWHGWRWVGDFNTEDALAPRTPVSAAAAPEPASLLLAILGGTGLFALTRRKK